ncbi:hypothetical protein U1Q18_001121, partial [Sarracenia purpurea var. burkii]
MAVVCSVDYGVPQLRCLGLEVQFAAIWFWLKLGLAQLVLVLVLLSCGVLDLGSSFGLLPPLASFL